MAVSYERSMIQRLNQQKGFCSPVQYIYYVNLAKKVGGQAQHLQVEIR